MNDSLSAFLLIFLAEMGDKSQLVCMLLASRYQKMPVILGASSAFALLNALAIVAASILALSIPHDTLLLSAALLFAFFGVKTLLEKDNNDNITDTQSRQGIFLAAFTMIFLAELGDKTQITVAALGASADPLLSYIGATLALISTTILGVLAGQWLGKYTQAKTLRLVAGSLFLLFSGSIALRLFS